MPVLNFLDKNGQWAVYPWVDNRQNSGIVITSVDQGTKAMLMAVFGLTGRASEALGKYMKDHAKPFWPGNAQARGRKISVYVCNILYEPTSAGDTSEPGVAKSVEVTPIDEKILEQYLRSK